MHPDSNERSGQGDKPWSNEFIIVNGDTYQVGYCMLFLIDDDHWEFDWSNTTNPDIDGDGWRDGPYRPGDSDAAVITDTNWNSIQRGGSHATALLPYGSAHNDWLPMAPHKETNILYGDDHVETHGTLRHYVYRVPNPNWVS